MGVAVKRLRIGRRRQHVVESSPLELARAPALDDGKWTVPDRYNFTRDVVEVLAEVPKRQALTFVGPDSVIEPRTFHELAEGSNKWAYILRERGIEPGDRVLVLSGATVDWVEIMLGCIKAGVIAVPCSPQLSAAALETRVSMTGASLIVAGNEAKAEIAQMSFSPEVHHIFEGRRRRATDVVEEQPTTDTSARDIALIAWTAGTTGTPRPVALTHGWTFAVRSQVAEWFDAGPRDVVWCAAPPGSAQALAGTLFGPWARGAEVVLRDGDFDPLERLELIHRFQTTILLQSAAEYRALAERRELPNFRSTHLRRLVSTGDSLDPEVVAAFEAAWGLTIHDGYGQAETGIVIGNGKVPMPHPDDEEEVDEETDEPVTEVVPTGSLGRALPGHHVAVVDEQGNELPPGIEGDLAVRGRPPTLFAGYWDSPDETRDAFRGDWYVTGDLAVTDADGYLFFVGRSEDVITSHGRPFGPHEVERALRRHSAVADSGVVGIRDLQRGGHFVRAYVVLAAGLEESEQLEAELRQFAGESVREQQVPREIVFVKALPRSASGAVRRSELRDLPVTTRPLWEKQPAPEPEPIVEPAAEVVPAAAPILEASRELSPEPGQVASDVEAARPVEQVAEAIVVPEPIEAVELPPVQEQGPTFVGTPDPVEAVEPAGLPPLQEHGPAFVVEPEPFAPYEPEPPTEPTAEAPAEQAPAAEPELRAVADSAPPPELLSNESLPDFVVDPERGVEPVAPPPPPEAEPAEEEDLGPLPEYVVDPDRRLEAVPDPEPAPAPSSSPPTPAPEPSDPSRPAFPPTPVLDLSSSETAARAPGEPERTRTSTSRPRPQAAESARSKRGGAAAEPGDEGAETSWMQGLSSRLSAYSLGSEARADSTPDDDGADHSVDADHSEDVDSSEDAEHG